MTTYNLEKYRDKREKVLGVRKRGISFGAIAAMVSFMIVLALSFFVVPKSIAFFNARHLDDAIYKLRDAENWPQEILPAIRQLTGVKEVVTDTDDTRIVITFDKSITDTKNLTAFFDHKGISTIMLNRVGHNERMATMKKEAQFEAP
jgi:hypothetical protein